MPARRERRFIADPESMKRVVALLLAPVVFQLALALVPPRAARPAALPPLPKRSSFRPAPSASATRSTARSSASPFSSRKT